MGRRKGRGKGQMARVVKENGKREGEEGGGVVHSVSEERSARDVRKVEGKREKPEVEDNIRGRVAVDNEKREREEEERGREGENFTSSDFQESPSALVAKVEGELESLTLLEESLRSQVAALRHDVAKARAQRDAGLERYNELLKAHTPATLQEHSALLRSRAHEGEGSPMVACCIALLVMLVAAVLPFFILPLIIVRQSVEPSVSTVEYVMERLLEPAVASGS